MSDIDPRSEVAYLGPPGTYSHAALVQYFGSEQRSYPVGDIPDVFSRVEKGESEYGLVPVENSSEGSVTLTLDNFRQSKLQICGETRLRVTHMLMAAPGTRPEDVRRIVSHQQSLGQCRYWLDKNYPNAERIAVNSNAEAARGASLEPGVAAIAGKAAADIYGLQIIAEAIEDIHDNTTRFWIISRSHRARPSGRDKTSLIVSTRNEPGALVSALLPLQRFGVNLTKLESRPSRKEAWSYTFFVDIDGHQEEEQVRRALNELALHTMNVRILGSYPVADEMPVAQPSRTPNPVLQDKKIVIVGLGLIGGSVARALADKGLNANLWAAGGHRQALVEAHKSGILAGFGEDVAEVCGDADLILIAVPGLAVAEVLKDLAPVVKPSVVITDTASVKQDIVDAVVTIFGRMPGNFVPGHPIAGSERSGFAAAKADLFDGRKVILTPLPETEGSAIELVQALWRETGADVLRMDVSRHDEVLAATSHLPHLLAYALVDTLSQQGKREDIFRYAAGGFRDFTRIASSDPLMWRDIFLGNGPATVRILDQLLERLDRLRQAVQARDGDYLVKVFTRAKQSRDKFMGLYMAREKATDNVINYTAKPGGQLTGEFRVPGDKSISHRAIILGALAEGKTTVEGFLEGEDALATVAVFRAMGVEITGPDQGRVTIEGVGMHGLNAPAEPLYLGNSGTSMRLLAGLLAAQGFPSVLTGDESLSRRPMKRVSEPLTAMGARIRLQEGGLAPIEIEPAELRPIRYDMPVASAQVKSCLLLASLYVNGETVVTEPAPSRDHTERMLRGFGYAVNSSPGRISLSGGGSLTACHIDIPADISSAAFFMVGASIAPGSDIVLKHVGINPTRTGVVNILRAMGADIEYLRDYEAGGEPVADIRVRYAPLRGIEIPVEQVPLAIDEFPALLVAAACAEGKTVLRGAEELRVKESDRIQAVADGLTALGVRHQVTPDGMIVEGSPMGGGVIDSKGDHRIAMAFLMAALRASEPIRILNCNNVATSFPGFAELASVAGVHVTVSQDFDD